MSDDGDEIQEAEAVEIPQPRPERVPRIKTRNPGKVNRILEGIALMYKDAHPENDCRWVYHPEHKRELSNVIARRAEGYQHVRVADLGEDAADLLDGEEVRVGDVVLMQISRVEREELIGELAERARDQSQSVEASFYEDQAETVVTGPDGAIHKARPRGSASIEEREFSIDQEQRTSE